MRHVFTLYLLFFASFIVAQNTTCNTADPFCTGTNYTFPASTNAPAPTGAYFDCLGTQPNPAFYFLEIDNPGNITINIQGLGVNGGTNDIDFICWGPFTNPNTMCNQLTAGNVEDCSYSATWNEFCNITGASSGDYYVLLITNYSNQACNINFQQTSGNATTNCCILGGNAGGDNNITRCEDAQQFDMFSQLTGNPDPGGTWYNPANLAVSNIFNPSVSQSGIYSYIVPGSSSSCPDDTAFLTININSLPNVSLLPFADLCDNEQTINLNSGTPSGGIYTVNGNISNTFTPSPFNIGTNNITYSYTDNNGCSSSISQSITVNETPSVITTTTNASCSGYSDGSAFINISGGTPSYNTNWFGVNPTQLSAGTYAYSVIDQNNCTHIDSIIIYEPSAITSSITHTNVLCFGDNNGTALLELQGSSAPAGTTSVLTYCNSQPGSNMTTNIENVELIGDMFNISNNTSGLCDSYEDYTNLFADITQGQNYTINVTLGDCSPNNYPSGAKIFIDWNIDGDFNDVGEHVGTIPNLPSSVFSVPITVPFSGFGATRMRIVSQFLNNLSVDSIGPCDVGLFSNPNYQQPWFGATEDYSIVINSPTVNATYIWSNGLTSDSIYGLSAGNYTVIITDNFGCITTDSVSILQPTALNVNYTTSNPNCHNGNDGGVTINISGGISDYTVNLMTFNQILSNGNNTYSSPQTLSAGTYTFNVIDSNNCMFVDSFSIINPQQLISNVTATNCDSYSWNGVTYYNSTLISNTFTSSNGCDSIVELNLSINNSSSGTTTISACDSYLWDNLVYNLTGTYTNTYINSAGCDSIHTLNLTINNSSSELSTIIACDSFLWDGVSYSSSGIYTNNYTNTAGCDSTHTLDLTINSSSSGLSTVLACDSFLWDGTSFTSSGTYTNNYTNSFGCDSTHTLDLTINNSSSGQSIITTCSSYSWNGTLYTSSGTYTNTYVNSAGCDSTHTLFLTIDPFYSGDSTYSSVIACNDYEWDLITYNASGVYTNTYTNMSGCDSVHILDLTINNSSTGQTVIISCDDYIWDNVVYTLSGIYTNTYTNISGCDSIHILDLTINNSTSNQNTISTCNSYTWNNQTYYSSGNYSYTYNGGSINGCDSTHTLNLIVNDSYLIYDSIFTCYDYTWNNNTYTTSGLYYDTLTTINGCDSIVGIHLFISDTTHSTYNINACDNYFWTLNNTTYQNSGIYINYSVNNIGCVHVDSLILNLSSSSNSNSNIIECDSFSWNNSIYTNTGIYNSVFINSQGCDSLATLNLTINYSDYLNINVTECNEYLWNNINYNISGNYLQTFINQFGCDSTVNLNLTIINGTQDLSVSIVKQDVSCFNYSDANIKLFVSGGIPPYSYSWSNGQVTSDIFNLNADQYSFIITDSIGCKLDSTIIINEPSQIQIYFSLENDSICRNDSTKLEINLDSPQFNYYTIILEDSIFKPFIIDSSGLLLIEKTPIYLSPNFNTNIVVKEIIDESGCINTINDTLPLIVNQLPSLNLQLTDQCFGDESFNFPVYLENEGTPAGGNYYINNKLQSFFDVQNLSVGEYIIGYDYTDTITKCSNFIEKSINIYPKPKAYFDFSPQPAFIDDPNILFIDKSIGMYYSTWNLGDGSILFDSLRFTYQYSDTGQYAITYTILNEFLCSDSIVDSLTILPNTKVFIPNSFTPNNDGNNDFFKPEMIVNGSVERYAITIYNKWGGIIFNEENIPWDGKNRGKICPIGTYSYSVKIVDFKNKVFNYTGTVQLLK